MKLLLWVLLASAGHALEAARQRLSQDELHQHLGPLNQESYAELDRLYLGREAAGNTALGRRQAEALAAAAPLDTGVLWRYARALIAAGDAESRGRTAKSYYASAEKSLEQAIDIDPDLAPAHYWMAVTRMRRGQARASVISELEAAIRLNPKDPRPHHLLGELYWNARRDRNQAIAEYQKALSLYRLSAPAARTASAETADGAKDPERLRRQVEQASAHR